MDTSARVQKRESVCAQEEGGHRGWNGGDAGGCDAEALAQVPWGLPSLWRSWSLQCTGQPQGSEQRKGS